MAETVGSEDAGHIVALDVSDAPGAGLMAPRDGFGLAPFGDIWLYNLERAGSLGAPALS